MNSKIRIIHLSASDSGGAYVFAENLINNLDKSKFESYHLIYTGKNETFKYSNLKPLDHVIKHILHGTEKLIQFFYEKNKQSRFKFSLGFPGIPYFLLKKKLKNFDVIHLHWINKGFINLKHLEKINKPIVWTCHDIWPVTGGCHISNGCENFKTGCGNCPILKKPSPNDLSARLFKAKAHIYKKTNITFVCSSEWMINNISQTKITNYENQLLIRNGIDVNLFKFRRREDHFKTNIGFVANNLNDANKALYRLVQALDHLEEKSKYHLILIGEQKSKFEFKIPISFEIHNLINDSSQIVNIYNEMDLLINTSTSESYSNILMEGFCCGVIGISFDIGGIREIASKMGQKCIPPYSIIELSQFIMNFKKDYSKQEISNKARALFGIEKTASQYGELYTNLIKQC